MYMINSKVIFLMISLLLSSLVLANDEVVAANTTEEEFRLFSETVDKFNEECLNDKGVFKPEVYVGETLTNCVADAKYIEEFYDHLGSYIDENPEAYKGYISCLEQKDEKKLSDFISDVSKVSQEMSCTEKDKDEYELKCSEKRSCNMYRSLNAAVEPLKDVWGLSKITKSVNRYTKNKVKESNFDTSKCLDDSEGNCIVEIFSSIIGNFVSTGESLWSLAKSTASGIMGLPSTIMNLPKLWEKKTEDAVISAGQSVDQINKLKNDSVGFFEDKYNSFMKTVDTFVKSSVFCQEWEGTPHVSNCNKPLEKYDCLDCNDKMNAVCAAGGTLLAEGGMIFLTGGIGNIAAMTTRMGAKAASELALKVSSKVKAVSPGMRAPASKTIHRLARSGKVNNKTAKVMLIANAARTLGSSGVTTAIAAIKAVAKAGKTAVHAAGKTKAGKVVKKTAEVIGKAKGVVDATMDAGVNMFSTVRKIETAGVKFSNKLMRRKNHHVTSSRAGRRAASAKKTGDAFKKGAKDTKASSATTSDNHSYDKKKTDKPTDTTDHTDPNKGKKKKAKEEQERRLAEEKQHHATEEKKKETAQKEKSERKKHEEEKRELAKKEEQKRKDEKKHHEEEEKKKKALASKKKAAAALLAAQAAGAASKMSEQEVNNEISEISNQTSAKAFDQFSSSEKNMESAMDALGMDPNVKPGSKEYNDQAQKMKDFYSGANKHSVVESIKSSNPGMSYSEANDSYEKRKGSVNSALDFVNKKQKVSKAVKEREAMKKDIANQRAEIQKQIADIKARKANPTALATATPQAMSTPYADRGQLSRGSSSSSPSNSKRAPSSVASSSNGSSFSGSGGGAQGSNASEESGTEFSSDELAGPSLPVAEGEAVAEELTQEEKLELEEKESEKEEKAKAKSSGLKSLLSGLGVENKEVVENASLEWENTDISAIDETGDVEKRRLEQYRRQFPTVQGKKEIYRGSTVSIESYTFPNQKPFNFRVSNNAVFIISAEDAALLKNALE